MQPGRRVGATVRARVTAVLQRTVAVDRGLLGKSLAIRMAVRLMMVQILGPQITVVSIAIARFDRSRFIVFLLFAFGQLIF